MERWSYTVALVLLAACGADEAGVVETTVYGVDEPVSGSRTVSQGGPQDIAVFRGIVARGEVPAPETLDPVGFFAEHAVDLPLADCGEDICMHPSLAVAPRFNGDNWTMAFIAMNTPVDPSTLERPPVHLAVAVDVSSSNPAAFGTINEGLALIAAGLGVDDRLSIIEYANTARVLVEDEAPETSSMATVGLTPTDTAADLYGALATAGRLVDADATGRAGRILLISSGAATAGITDEARIVTLAESYARAGVAISVVGFGDPSAREAALLSQLGDLGAGTFSLAEDDSDLAQILDNQARTSLFPLATDFSVAITPSEGYRVGRVWGARRGTVKDGVAFLDSPALFVGHRTGASDTSRGRRGGGGLFVELIAEDGAGSLGPSLPAFSYEASWIANDGTPRTATAAVINTLAPGQNPDVMWPEFSAGEKPFMMLNMYLALRTAIDLYAAGDCARARGVEDMMAPSVEVYQARLPDEDIGADWILLQDLSDNITRQCGEALGVDDPETIRVIEPVGSSAGCFFS
ncbi:MAG: hypothetical protein JRH11_07115 [Deltaproteobacteria bacterium]|nr:hypothetical protein [Deltaproteobacteria bacterium]